VYEVEGILEINDRENLAALDTVQEVAGEWEQVTVLLGDGVEGTIIHAETQFTRLAVSKEDRRDSGACGTADKSLWRCSST